jgi:hypothetical protein
LKPSSLETKLSQMKGLSLRVDTKLIEHLAYRVAIAGLGCKLLNMNPQQSASRRPCDSVIKGHWTRNVKQHKNSGKLARA